MATRVPRPDSLLVGNHRYRIEWLTPDEWFDRDCGQGNDGLTYNDRGVILMRLLPTRQESMYQETLIHEVQHAIWATAGLPGEWNAGDVDDVEENLMRMTTPLLLSVLKNNPDITKYLLSDGGHIR